MTTFRLQLELDTDQDTVTLIEYFKNVFKKYKWRLQHLEHENGRKEYRIYFICRVCGKVVSHSIYNTEIIVVKNNVCQDCEEPDRKYFRGE